MAKILLTSKPIDGSSYDRAFAVVAPGYPRPTGMPVVPLGTLLMRREDFFGGDYSTMIVVGLSRILTPSNRVRLGQVLLRPREHVTRVSVDSLLFVSDPWRMWWHFYAVGAERWGYTDSFLAETRWKRAIELQEPDPFGSEAVLAAARGVVTSDETAFRFPDVSVETIPAGHAAQLEYAELKEHVFTHEKTAAAIIGKLAAFAQKSVPQRNIPTMARLFKSPPRTIVRSDLRIDEFLTGQVMSRIALTNAIADGCRE